MVLNINSKFVACQNVFFSLIAYLPHKSDVLRESPGPDQTSSLLAEDFHRVPLWTNAAFVYVLAFIEVIHEPSKCTLFSCLNSTSSFCLHWEGN